MERRRLTRKIAKSPSKKPGAFRNFDVRNAPFLLSGKREIFPKTRLFDAVERFVERQETVRRGEEFQDVRDAFRMLTGALVDAL